MSNYSVTKEEIKNYIIARTPLIIVNSSERERVERMLRSIGHDLGIEVYYYTDAKQVTQFNSDSTGDSIDAENDPLHYMASMFRKKRNVTFAFGDVKRISEDTIYTREIINVLYLAKESASTLILITPDPVYQRITQFGMITKLDFPDLEERRAQIREFVEAYSGRFTIEWGEDEILRAATLLRGFSEIQIDNILSNEMVSSNGLLNGNIFKLTAQKSKLYAAVSCIQQVNVPRDMTVSGLENLKQWLDEKRQVFFSSDIELDRFGLTSPKGILLAGVPGCGKSFSAKMVAREWELPLFRFDIGSIYDKWMGESERKMKDALDFIDNVSPCVLWIDEIEKALSVSDGSNDTSQRILGQFLFWLQESKSRVFMVATANDITKLPTELFRKGRFSEIFFVDLPTADERRTAIKQYTDKCLHIRYKDEQLDELVELSAGFSFSEIEYAIKEIAQVILIHGTERIDMNLIRERFNTIVPIEKSNPETVNKIRMWGAEKAVPAHK